MSTTREDIRHWIKDAQEKGATHLLVVCDTFSYEDYPVPVKKDESVHCVYRRYDNIQMQRVVEVYKLSLDIEAQLQEDRAFHF